MSDDERLAPGARSRLEAYRALRTPGEAKKAAALAAVAERIHSGNGAVHWDGPDPSGAPGTAGSGTTGFGKWLALGATAVLATGAVLLLQQPEAPQQALPPTPGAVELNEPERAATEAAESPVASAAEPSTPAEPLASSSTAPEPPALEDPRATARAHSRRPSSTSSPEPSESSAPPTSTLREEMKLLSRGQRAFNAGDFAGALGAFDEHRARFPGGALASERELKRIATLCRMGRAVEARALTERYASAHPGSPSAEKARRICPEAP